MPPETPIPIKTGTTISGSSLAFFPSSSSSPSAGGNGPTGDILPIYSLIGEEIVAEDTEICELLKNKWKEIRERFIYLGFSQPSDYREWVIACREAGIHFNTIS